MIIIGEWKRKHKLICPSCGKSDITYIEGHFPICNRCGSEAEKKLIFSHLKPSERQRILNVRNGILDYTEGEGWEDYVDNEGWEDYVCFINEKPCIHCGTCNHCTATTCRACGLNLKDEDAFWKSEKAKAFLKRAFKNGDD